MLLSRQEGQGPSEVSTHLRLWWVLRNSVLHLITQELYNLLRGDLRNKPNYFYRVDGVYFKNLQRFYVWLDLSIPLFILVFVNISKEDYRRG